MPADSKEAKLNYLQGAAYPAFRFSDIFYLALPEFSVGYQSFDSSLDAQRNDLCCPNSLILKDSPGGRFQILVY